LAPTALKLAVLFVIYNLILVAARPEVDIYFDAGTAAAVLGERYLYGPTADAVIVGSSLSRVLPRLPEHYYNLAMFGGSPATGLEIVLRKGDHPKVVIVESNYAMRPIDRTIIDDLLEPAHFELRKLVPALRVEYRPLQMLIPLFDPAVQRKIEDASWQDLGLLIHQIRSLTPFPGAGKTAAKAPPPAEPGPQPVDEEETPGLGAAVADLRDAYADADGRRQPATARAIAALSGQVAELRRRGICVVLVRFPIHPEVAATPYMSYGAAMMAAAFPADGDWLSVANGDGYGTRDGLHLTVESSARYASGLIKAIAAAVAGQQQPAGTCKPH
jgi:hypothetical protein